MTDLDDLMSRLAALDAKDVGLWSDADIDDIIAYQRNQRAKKEAGIKPARGAKRGVKLDLVALGLRKPPEAVKRRI